MRYRLPAAAGAFVIGATLLVSACGSSSKNTSTHASTTTSNSASQSALEAGPDPCRLVTPQVIFTTLKERMARVSRSKSSCNYATGGIDHFSISTAKTTRAGAEAAVTSTASTVKGKVLHESGIGDNAIAYLVTTKTLSTAHCLFAKNGALVFLYVSSPKANHLTAGIVALAMAAASRTY